MKKHNFILLFLFFIPFVVNSQVFVKTLKGPSQWATSAAFSKDGKKLYVGCYDKLVWVFDLASSKVSDTLKFHSGAVTTIDVSASGLIASAGWDKQIALWEEGKKQPLFVLNGHQDKINYIKFSPDGKQLASVGDDGKLILWDAVTGGIIKQIEAHKDPATSLCYRSDGNIVATTSWDKTIKLWSVASGELIAELKGHRNSTNSVQFSENNKFIVSGSDDNSMIVWETDSNRIFKKFDFYKKPVAQAFFINNDNQLISVDHQGEIKVYNTNNHQMLSVKNAHTGKINAYVWSPAMSLLVTVGIDLSIHLWDMSEYTFYECLKKKTPALESLKKAKGEFETTDQYEKRLADYDKRKLLLVEECKKEAILEQRALEQMKLEKDAEAYSWVNINLTSIGAYNADAAEYPVTIGSKTYMITMQMEDAKTFKDNWQKAKVRAVRKDLGNNVFEYYNLEMEHPISKTKFMFGEYLTARIDPAFKIFMEKQQKK
jgi:WD40 repeat protein